MTYIEEEKLKSG